MGSDPDKGGFMKKSTIVAFVALVMVFIYIFTAGNKFSIYEKEIFYKTPEDAIHNFMGFINVQEKIKNKEGYYSNEVPKEFLESISKRYRLYTQNAKRDRYVYNVFPSFKNCTLREIKEDEDKDYINSNYQESFREIKGYKKAADIRFFRIEGDCYYYQQINREDVNEDGTINSEFDDAKEYNENKGITIDLIVIDEGEGYVVDYYNTSY